MPGLSRYFNKKFFVLVNYSSEDGELLILVEKAIAHYDGYYGNYEQREEERKENKKIHEAYFDEIRKKGILDRKSVV